jgi:aldehyde dehydrogenase (NAD+)
VAAAKAALPAWSATGVAERRAFVERILAEYRRRERDFAQAISLEMGAPIDFALAEQAPSFLARREFPRCGGPDRVAAPALAQR